MDKIKRSIEKFGWSYKQHDETTISIPFEVSIENDTVIGVTENPPTIRYVVFLSLLNRFPTVNIFIPNILPITGNITTPKEELMEKIKFMNNGNLLYGKLNLDEKTDTINFEYNFVHLDEEDYIYKILDSLQQYFDFVVIETMQVISQEITIENYVQKMLSISAEQES